jgi:hypothetical protein
MLLADGAGTLTGAVLDVTAVKYRLPSTHISVPLILQDTLIVSLSVADAGTIPAGRISAIIRKTITNFFTYGLL